VRREAAWLALAGSAFVAGYLISAYYVVYKVVPHHLQGEMNIYVAQPLIWGGLAVLAFWLWRRQPDRPRLSRTMLGLALVAAVFQLSALVTAGVLYGFGHSPHAGQALNMAKNGLYIGTLLLGFEMARSYLLLVWGRVHSLLAFAVVALLFTALAIAPGQYAFFGGTERAFEVSGGQFLPTAAESVLATFLASVGGPLPAFAYRFTLAAFDWFSPVLPNLEWPIRAFVGTLGPALAMLIVRDIYLSSQSDEEEEEDGEERSFGVSPLWMLASMVIVGILWLNTGLLGVTPALVSGHSMSPAFETGDVVFTREIAAEDLRVGDIIRYRKGGVVIMHRIIEVEKGSTGPVFVTQGDANNAIDPPILAEQVEGEVVFVIPEVGWPRIFLGNLLDSLW
jgi:signal peptidase